MKTPKVVGLAAAIATLGFGLSGTAHAISYGIAYQNITNGSLTFSNFNNATGGAQSGGTTQSATNADLTGFASVGDSQTKPRGAVPADALAVSLGDAVRGQNVFNSFVVGGTTGNYSNADAQVVSEQLQAGQFFAARNIAEYYVSGNNTAGSRGGNGSTTGFILTFEINGAPGGTADFLFQFNNDPYMRAFLDTAGGSATADLVAKLQLTKILNGLSVGALSWSPDGIAGNVTGAASLGAASAVDVDPFNLNTGISLTSPVGAPVVYDPTGGGFAGGGTGLWSLSIDDLPVGQYSLALEMEERSRGNNSVPEPGTIALLAVGLIGIARRRLWV